MARYSFEARDTADATLASGGLLEDATTQRRCKIYDWMVGSEAAPGDTALLWVIDRGDTALGTSSDAGASPLDMADAVSISDARENFTVNPTLGVRLMSVPLNQRATFRWVAAPGSELVLPASANASLLTRTPTSTAIAITSTTFYSEE